MKNLAVIDDYPPEDSKIINIRSNVNRQSQAKSSYANRRKQLESYKGTLSYKKYEHF